MPTHADLLDLTLLEVSLVARPPSVVAIAAIRLAAFSVGAVENSGALDGTDAKGPNWTPRELREQLTAVDGALRTIGCFATDEVSALLAPPGSPPCLVVAPVRAAGAQRACGVSDGAH